MARYKKNILEDQSIDPSDRAIRNICDSEKFCKKQGKIAFGQLRSLVESAKTKKLVFDVGEGGFKATLRLLPWFFPQLALAGFTGSVIRAFNKIFRPALEDTTGYKTWWGKTVMRIFNLVEGDLGVEDPLSKIFFVSDGLLTMIDNREKIKFARYISEVAEKKPDSEEVPDFFVENELRNWLNERFLLDPPLPPKKINKDSELPFMQEEYNGVKKRSFSKNVDDHELKWHFDEQDRKVKIVKSNGWMLQFDDELPKKLVEGQVVFIPKGKYHRVLKGDGDLVVEIKELISEKRSGYRNYIRMIVKDIITIFKKNDQGTFILPEDINDNKNYYDLPHFGENLQVELSITENVSIKGFSLDASYYYEEEIISVEIDYNPNYKKNMIYDLVGELNEIIAHELRHVEQKSKGTFEFTNSDDFEEIEDPFEYYTQPKEIDAQIKGFKRLSFLTKKPFEFIVRKWFDTHKEIHRLNNKESEKVITMILNKSN